MVKYLVVFLFLHSVPIDGYAAACENLDKKSCSVLKDFVVADKYNEMHFNHLCSALGHYNNHSQRAYAFFEKMDFDQEYKALVLGEVSIGHIGWAGVDDKKGIWLSIDKMQIESLNRWANDSFSLALQLQNTRTNQVVMGEFSNTFYYSYKGSGYPTDEKYSISIEGELNWEQFKEPEEEEAKTQIKEQENCISCEKSDGNMYRPGEHKISKGMYIRSSQIIDQQDPHILYVVMKNERTKEIIQLQGPTLKSLKTYMDIEYSGPRVLTWEVLMPGQEGGFWDFISDAFKYGSCIYLRKQSKNEFTSRFTNQ